MKNETNALDSFWKSAEDLISRYLILKDSDLENQIKALNKGTLSSVIISLQASNAISISQADELRKTFL